MFLCLSRFVSSSFWNSFKLPLHTQLVDIMDFVIHKLLLIPVSSYKVRGKLCAQLLKGSDGVRRQSAEPHPHKTLQRNWEGLAYDLICHTFCFKWLQVIQGILWPFIGFYLQHIELCRKGEWSDGCYERWVRPMDQLIKVIWHPPLEGTHHKFHSFLHHLHLRDHMWWCCICGGWTVGILSLLLLPVTIGPSIPLA